MLSFSKLFDSVYTLLTLDLDFGLELLLFITIFF